MPVVVVVVVVVLCPDAALSAVERERLLNAPGDGEPRPMAAGWGSGSRWPVSGERSCSARAEHVGEFRSPSLCACV